MQDEYYVYTHSKPDGTIFYVGKGKGSRCHVLTRRNKHHKNIVFKYGKENIIVTKVIEFISEANAINEEIKLIAKLRSEGILLTNMTDGGEGMSGYVMPQETKDKLSNMNSGDRHPMYGTKRAQEVLDKMSKALKGRTLSIETRARMSNSRKGEKNAFWGKQLPLETRNKISETLRNSGYMRGIPRTEETKAKISKANSGENNGMFGVSGEKHPNYGKKCSEESKLRMSVAHKDILLTDAHKEALSKAQKNRWDNHLDLHTKIRTILINELLFDMIKNTISPQMVYNSD